jgi:RES domain-containing protein
MPRAWRIVKRRHVETAFTGEGARLYGGRWNSPGTSVVYTAETRALSILEVLAGIRSVKPLPAYVLIPATFDDSLVKGVQSEEQPTGWRRSPPHPETQGIGDHWVDQQPSAILRVPSAIVPEEFNYLLNPAHQDFPRIQIGTPQDLTIDPRLPPWAPAS